MAYRTTRVTFASTGPTTVPTSFTPEWVEMLVGSKYNTTDTQNHISNGSAGGTFQNCISTGSSGTNHMTKTAGDRLVSHWEYNGSAWVEVLRVNFVGFNDGTAPGSIQGIDVNVIISNPNYQVVVRRGN